MQLLPLHYIMQIKCLFIPNITGLRERQNGRVMKLRLTDINETMGFLNFCSDRGREGKRSADGKIKRWTI